MRESKFQFVNPYLIELNFEVNQDLDIGESYEVEMRNAFNVQIKRKKDENRANVTLILETNIGEEKAPFQIRAAVASDFRWEDLEEKQVEAFLKYNAPALLLGYLRPIVANITNSSNFPAYNLPFVNFKE